MKHTKATRKRKIKFPARRKPVGYRKLINIDSDAKTIKGRKQNYLTGIMYLAPHTSSGVIDTCGMASAGCIAACLNLSGRAEVFPDIIEARIDKTRFMVSNPDAFRASLVYDVETVRRRALKQGMKPAVRINGTSDLPKLVTAVAGLFPDVQFYDYTKLPNPWLRQLPNYSLTFSHSETNLQACLDALAHGVNVAVVFGLKKGTPMPATWHGYRVVNGDDTDLRFTDPKGAVVGLYAKGRAKKDCSGFVVRDLIQIALVA